MKYRTRKEWFAEVSKNFNTVSENYFVLNHQNNYVKCLSAGYRSIAQLLIIVEIRNYFDGSIKLF